MGRIIWAGMEQDEMSVKMMGLVWDCNLPSNEKYILLAYADHADHDGGNIFPAVSRVAWKTGYDERTIQRATKQLIEKGVLVPDGKGKRGTNRYRIEVSCLPEREEYDPRQNVTPVKMSPQNGQNVTPRGGTVSPEPSVNHPIEPSSCDDEKWGQIQTAYQNNITISIAPITVDEMQQPEYYNLPIEWWIQAIAIAAGANKRAWRYIKGVLDRSIASGLSPEKTPPPKPTANGYDPPPEKPKVKLTYVPHARPNDPA